MPNYTQYIYILILLCTCTGNIIYLAYFILKKHHKSHCKARIINGLISMDVSLGFGFSPHISYKTHGGNVTEISVRFDICSDTVKYYIFGTS